MTAFNSAKELARQLSGAVSLIDGAIIGVDGYTGVGKTTLAGQIANEIGGKVLSLDSYLEKNRGRYLPNLRIEEFRNDLNDARGPLVIEGVCLLAALSIIGVQLKKLIYVKRIGHYGTWKDRRECNPQEPVEDAIRKLEEDVRSYREISGRPNESGSTGPGTKSGPLPELVKELMRYHAEYRPHAQADYVFHRLET